MNELKNYDFSGKRVRFYIEHLRRWQSLTKFDIAYHLDHLDSNLPWTVMYDVYKYSELKALLRSYLVAS